MVTHAVIGTGRVPTSVRAVAIGALFVAACGCSDEPQLREFDATSASRLAADVDEGRLTTLLKTLSDSHASGTPIPCQSLEADYPLACHLSHSETRALIRQEIQTLGLPIRLPMFDGAGVDGTNVIADIVGTQPDVPIVLVGGHYDAYFTGADDNSSGIAALLELARICSQHAFSRTIRFVAFDLEEIGLQGSSHYVATESNREHRLAFILDSLGSRKTTPDSQPEQLGLPWPSVGDFLMVQANQPAGRAAAEFMAINDRLRLAKLFTAVAPDDGDYLLTEGLLNSDHVPFWLAGLSTLSLTDVSAMRETRYHTDGDVFDIVDTSFLAANVRAVAAAIAYFAEVER